MDIAYNTTADQMLRHLPRGAFLSVRSGNKINTMTIGWGAVGYMWRKPILMVAVRYSRYTYELLKEASDFSVCLPGEGQHKTNLAIAGSKSGRDINKFTELKLTAQPGRKIESPVIEGCSLVYECKIIYRDALDPASLDPAIKDQFYSDGDYHVLYFGEILEMYSS
ncbi:MAG: flavin reductase family protein [Syntrophomonadaceae bacterium]